MARDGGKFDRKEVIREMQLISDSKELIPLTVRIEAGFYKEMEKFCEAMDIRKSVMLRRLMRIGWEVVIAQEMADEKTHN